MEKNKHIKNCDWLNIKWNTKCNIDDLYSEDRHKWN